jgi:membrane glycosyltransferase
MQLCPEDLEPNHYQLLDKLDHKELTAFIMAYLKKGTVYTVLFCLLNLVFATAVMFLALLLLKKYHYGFNQVFLHAFGGFLLTFLLVPVHELIHAAAYKLQGARHTNFDANLRKFYFYAIADQFVASRREFTIVALAPFAVITLLLLALLPVLSPLLMLTVLSIVFTHTSFCSGDFGLLSYFAFHKDKTIVTYDDKEEKMSFFYWKKV